MLGEIINTRYLLVQSETCAMRLVTPDFGSITIGSALDNAVCVDAPGVDVPPAVPPSE